MFYLTNSSGYVVVNCFFPQGLLTSSGGGGAAANSTATIKDGTFWEQLKSFVFLRMTLFIVVGSFWANFYIGTIDIQVGRGTCWDGW